MSITSIEDLSNEFFYEMFDFLDGFHIYEAFSNLNYRFQQLLKSSSLLFKIKLDSIPNKLHLNNCKKFILFNKHRILSFHLSISEYKRFVSLFSIDSSFDRLESLVLNDIEPTILYSILSKLTCLPRLFSLTIDMGYYSDDLIDIYKLIFALPKLKYTKCSARGSNTSISIPFAINNELSAIEHLIINHYCTSNELAAILSYTPQVHHLKISHLNDSDSTIETILPIRLLNLTTISLDLSFITFDEFKMFITSLECKLKVLYLNIRSEDMDYLDANQWEELIIKYLPQLEEFYFQHYKEIELESNCIGYIEDFNQFTSPFWIDRKWVFETEMDSCEIMYSIRSYKKRWCDIESSIEQPFKSTRLILTCPSNGEYPELPTMTIDDISTPTHFYHLEFQREKVDFITLINITHTLSELDSLKIHSLALSTTKSLSGKELVQRFMLNENKITKVCLENMIKMEEVYFLIKLCPRMNYLQLTSINNMDVKLFVRDILNKINYNCHHYLRSLSFCIPTANDKMVKELKEMIDSKKLLFHYSIKREHDRIYLSAIGQWLS